MRGPLRLVLLASLAGWACGVGPVPEQAPPAGRVAQGDAEAIAAAIREIIQAYDSGDADRLNKVYADDFIDLSEGAPTHAGPAAREAAATRLRDTFSCYAARLDRSTDEIHVDRDIAYARGRVTLTLTPKDGGAPSVVDRRILEVWRKGRDGSWRITRAMDNVEGGRP